MHDVLFLYPLFSFLGGFICVLLEKRGAALRALLVDLVAWANWKEHSNRAVWEELFLWLVLVCVLFEEILSFGWRLEVFLDNFVVVG